MGGRGYGDVGRRRLCTYHYVAVTTRMVSALRWAAMRDILMFHNCEGQSHKTVSTDHNFWKEKRAEADSNWGPSAYQLNALPPRQTGSQNCFFTSVPLFKVQQQSSFKPMYSAPSSSSFPSSASSSSSSPSSHLLPVITVPSIGWWSFSTSPFSDLTCTGYPGPGVDHHIMLNPVHEFVHGDDSHTPILFQQFKDMHGKVYDGDVEHESRQHIFRQNVR